MAGKPGYPEYKSSRDPWLGEFPAHWREVPIKRIARVDNSGAYGDEPGTQAVDFPVATTAQISAEGKFDVERMPIRSFSGADVQRYACNPDDILIVKSSGSAANIISGKAGLVDTDTPSFVYSNFLMRLVPKRAEVHPRFLYALIVSSVTRERVQRMVSTTTYPNLQVGEYVNAVAPCPSLEEQIQIAKFLDYETAKIDALIEKQQQLIALLKEKRQAVINHAVTKGLNPDAPMRDSGIEWLGEIPAHWRVLPLKYLCDLLKDGTHLPPPRVSEGVPLLSVRNLQDSRFGFRDDDSQISEASYQELCRSFIPAAGDVFMAIVGATLGKVAVVPEMDRFHIQRSLACMRPTPSMLDSKYLAGVLSSSRFQDLLWANVGFSAQPGIYLGAIENFRVPVPPIDEQVKISGKAEAKTAALDTLVDKAERSVVLMEERRSALISAAVTGKIDLRGWKTPHSDSEAEIA